MQDENDNPKSVRRKRSPNAPPVGPAKFSSPTSETIADGVYRRLRRDIVTNNLTPGTPISEKGRADIEGVSRTPVREAILRLTEEKLVEVVPKSGTFVARIPLSALPEAFVMRIALEQVTTKAAAQNATPKQISRLRQLISQQQQIARQADPQAFSIVDDEFHAEIARIGGYPGVWEVARLVKVQIDRCRRLTLPIDGRMKVATEEHFAVVDAIEAGDPQNAASLMENHLSNLKLDIDLICRMWPDYFIHDLAAMETLK